MPAKKQTFEEKMQRIDEIAEQLNSDTLALDDLMSLYKEGKKLISECKDILDAYGSELKDAEEKE